MAALLVLLAAACSDGLTAPTERGNIKVSVETSGGDPDEDGYEVVVPSEARRFVTSQGTTVIIGISAGIHTVALERVAPNCRVSGAHPLTVTVPADQTAEIAFVIVCTATGIEVTTRTTGDDNPFGYQLAVYDLVRNIPSSRPTGANGSLVVGRLQPGTHTVDLQMPNDHCSVSSKHPITVEVSNLTVTPVLFEITCVPPVRLEKIAYVVDRIINGSQESRIALVNPDGSGAAEVASGDAPTWSPDGARLVFSTTQCEYYYGCSGDLVLADPETRNFMTLSAGSRAFSPAWAPTGDVIAFIRDQSGMYLMKLDGSPALSLNIPAGILVSDPAWSPDGRRIAFRCMIATSNFDVCVINRDGTGLVRLTSDAIDEGHPAWRPDGRKIAFTRNSGRPEIALMAADGSGVMRLTDGFDPAWSPDGSKLVFARDGLYTINVDGSNLTRLTTGSHHAPAWRP
jgi:TolB protein